MSNKLFSPGDKVVVPRGKLIYISDIGWHNNSYYGIWKCYCGREFKASNSNIKSKRTKSCGCLKKMLDENKVKDSKITNLNRLWNHIKDRCFNIKCNAYKNYGGRGITMQEDWINDSEKFIQDVLEKLGPRPERCSFDRINNDGNYEINNVRWGNYETQLGNTSKNIIITINGITKIAAQWAKESGIKAALIISRFKKGWTGDKIFSKPKLRQTNIENLYGIWSHIKQRCYNTNNPAYNRYGGRGITLHQSWIDNFKLFEKELIEEIGPRSCENLTLERINNDGSYEPGNLCWATMEEQSKNRSSNIIITINKETKLLSEWAAISGIDQRTLSTRIKNGCKEEKLLEPVLKKKFEDDNLIIKIRDEYLTGKISIAKLANKYKTSLYIIRNIIRHRGAYSD